MSDPGAAPGAGRSPEASMNQQQAAGSPPFVDTPVLQAKRRAFDHPTVANLDALIEAVREDAAGVSAAPSGWQGIETAPTDQRVLALLKVRPLAAEGEIAFVYWAGAVWTYDETGVACEPEWWLPLPPTPASASPQEDR